MGQFTLTAEKRKRHADANKRRDEGEDYDPKAKEQPRKQSVPVEPKGTLKKFGMDEMLNEPLRKRLAAVPRLIASELGANATNANRLGEEFGSVADFIPVVGDQLGVAETKEAIEQGDWKNAGINAAATAVGVVPGAGDLAAKGIKKLAGKVAGGETKAALKGTEKILAKVEKPKSQFALKPEKRAKVAAQPASQFSLADAQSASNDGGPGSRGMRSELPMEHGRISQRVPTSPDATENPHTDNLLINMDVLKSEPAKMQQAADAILQYPGFGSKQMQEMGASERLDAARDQMSDNLLHMYDMTPPEGRARSSQWYLGANRISNERAAETGFHPNSAAGVYAALSPQKDWFMNVNLGDKVLRTLAENPRMTSDHMRMAQSLFKPEQFELLRGLEGMRLSEMDPTQQAIAIRAMDEASGPRPYRKISPEGDYGEFMMTGKGAPSQAAWQTTPNIEKAVRAAQSGGDTRMLSELMGGRHKVRNFYNNIVAPKPGEFFGDITADTHQIAASLFRPLGGSAPEVNVGLGGGSPTSNLTGLRGLYPVYADATRKASVARGEPVRAMQSIPWEGIRSLFPDTFKTGKNQSKIDDIWRAFERGEITANDARRHVIDAAGGFRPPTW